MIFEEKKNKGTVERNVNLSRTQKTMFHFPSITWYIWENTYDTHIRFLQERKKKIKFRHNLKSEDAGQIKDWLRSQTRCIHPYYSQALIDCAL